MDSVVAFRPLPNCFSLSRNPRLSNFAVNRRIKIQTFASKSPKHPRIPLPIPRIPLLFIFQEASRSVGSREEERPALPPNATHCVAGGVGGVLLCSRVFTVSGGSECRIRGAAGSEAVLDKEEVNLEYTKRLLETLCVLLKSVGEVRGGKGNVKLAEAAWKAVRGKEGRVAGPDIDICKTTNGIYLLLNIEIDSSW